MRDGDKSALDYFTSAEIGDFDNDGMREILDAWGQPVEFLRWAPGYLKGAVATMQTNNSDESPDPFDPLKVDNRWSDADPTKRPYALHPLIYSPGPDKVYQIGQGESSPGTTTDYSQTTPKK